MTGAMLRRIRKAYRLDVAQIANAAGLAVQTVRMTELTGKSYACGRQDRDARRRAQVWRAYLKALRVLRVGRKPVIPSEAKSVRHGVLKPSPDAVLVERDGVREWVKVVEYADGRKYGFVWRDGDWYRTAWVEERFLGRKVTPRFAEGDEAYPDAGLARWRNGY